MIEWPHELPIACVEWVDSSSHAGWHSRLETEEFLQDTCHIHTVGYVIQNDADAVAMAMSIGEEVAGDLIRIPTSLVLNIWQLSKPEKE